MPKLTLPLSICCGELALRRVTPAHTAPLWRALETSREQVRPWLCDIPESLEETHDWTQKYTEKARHGTGYAYAITPPKGHREILGCLTAYEVFHTPRLSELTLAYWVATPHTGRGIAKRALGSLLGVTDQKGIHTLLTIGKANTPSQRLATALGYEIVDPEADDHNFNYYRCARR